VGGDRGRAICEEALHPTASGRAFNVRNQSFDISTLRLSSADNANSQIKMAPDTSLFFAVKTLALLARGKRSENVIALASCAR